MIDRENIKDIVENYEKLPIACKYMFFQMFSFPFNKTPELNMSDFVFSYRFNYGDCESPIETMLALALDFMLYVYGVKVRVEKNSTIIANNSTYRADFLIEENLIVECDGHDFHEKTKEQVERGNRRNYDLQMEGYEVIHFSGSEIYNDPFGCAKKVAQYMFAKGWA